MLPQCNKVYYNLKRGEANALVYIENQMPWPFANRDLVFHYSGVADYTNHAFLTISKSLPPGSKYFGVEVPEAQNGCVRMDFKHMLNFF